MSLRKKVAKIDFNGKYRIVAALGKGSYGNVYEALPGERNRKISPEETVAIKHIPDLFASRTMAKRILRELRLLRCLKGHPNIVKLLDVITHKKSHHNRSFSSVSLVLECMECDLKDILSSDQFFSKGHVQYILYQIICAVNHMHQMNIAHRDLKPANILINADCDIRVCDFGLSRNFSVNDNGYFSSMETDSSVEAALKKLTNHVVTRWYRAPEIILLSQTRKHLPKVDMWAIGCIFAELLTMLPENEPDAGERMPLFPGSACYPLSPAKTKAKKMRNKDQLAVIFSIIGKPTPEDCPHVVRDDALTYLESFEETKPINFRLRYPGSDQSDLGLLKSLLLFNIERRISARDAIRHPFVQRFRSKKRETLPTPVFHEFEDKEDFQLDDYKALMKREINLFLTETSN